MPRIRVHHLNVTTLCVPGGPLVDGRSRSLTAPLVCHVLLVELPETLMLVDTGFGLNDVRAPRPRNPAFNLSILRPDLREDQTAIRQIEALGFRGDDVGHIALTHLDFDHAGGLDDFPRAEVHLLGAEYAAAKDRPTWMDRRRYRPMQWGDRENWHAYPMGTGEKWFGFDAVRDLDDVDPEVLLVPLIGHTHGHAGVAIDTGEGWLLHCGDAYFFHAEMTEKPWCPPILGAYERLMQSRRALRVWNQDRLRELRRDHSHQVTLFCAHDAVELERLVAQEEREVRQFDPDEVAWYP